MEAKVTGRGRPPRPQIEVVRVVTWYYAVRKASKWSETKLEIYFDKLDRSSLGRHRGSRWNKYKAGITTPSRDLVEQVGRAFKGTIEVFDHPVWLLASSERLGVPVLRDLVLALPRDIAAHLVRPGAVATSEFWVRNDLDHEAVAAQFLQSHGKQAAAHLSVVAGLLALAHDAKVRQLESQHFAMHLAVAAIAAHAEQIKDDKFSARLSWRLEALVLQRWLDTEYTEPRYRAAIGELRAISSGPLVPWASVQGSLKLGRGPSKKEAADLQNSLGYWVGQRVLAWRRENRLGA